MRIGLSFLLIFLAPSAAAQAAQTDKTCNGELIVTLEPEDSTRKTLQFPEHCPLDRVLEELRKQGITSGPGCSADYADIDAEQKESDARRRAMRDKVIPLKDQYEQELYYKERRAKRYAETCAGKDKPLDGGAKPFDPVFKSEIPQKVDMTRKACEVIGEICRPVKHW